MPAIAPDDCTIPIGPGRVKHWHRGEPLQPKREDVQVLEAIKREIGSQRFAAQYLQQPVPDGGNAIKREWLPSCTLLAFGTSLVIQSGHVNWPDGPICREPPNPPVP